MADSKEVSIKITARDETANAFASAGARMEAFLKERGNAIGQLINFESARSAIEIANKVGESMSKLGEAMTHFSEQYERAANEVDRQQAIHDLAKHSAEAIPAVGALVHGIGTMKDGLRDAYAMWLKAHGASEETVDSWRSDGAYMAHYNEIIAQQTEVIASLTVARKAMIAETLRGIGGGAAGDALRTNAQAQDEAETRHNENLKKNYEERHKLMAQIGDSPDERQKQVLAAMRQQELLEDQRFQAERIHLATEAANRIGEALAKEAADIDKANLEKRHYLSDLAASQREFEQRDINDRRDADEFVLDMEAEAQAIRLRLAKDESGALLAELHRRHDRELSDINQAEKLKLEALEEAAQQRRDTNQTVDEKQLELEKTRASQIAVNARTAAESRFRAQEEQTKINSGNLAMDEAEARRHTLAGLKLDLLKEEAALGNQAAKAAAEALGIQEKFNEKRAEANRLLREGLNLSPAEKKQLEESIQRFDTIQRAEEAKMRMGVIGPQTSPFSQTSELGPGDTGMREIFAAQSQSAEDRQLETQQKILDGILAQNQLIANLDKKVGDLGANLSVA